MSEIECPLSVADRTDLVGTLYYEHGEDLSIGTYGTDYVMAALCITLGLSLMTIKRPEKDMHVLATRLMGMSLFVEAGADLCGAYFHQFYHPAHDSHFRLVWSLTMTLLLALGWLRGCASIVLLSNHTTRRLAMLSTAALAGLLVGTVWVMNAPFLIFAVCAVLAPTVGLVASMVAHRQSGTQRLCAMNGAVALVLTLASAYVHGAGAGPCATPCPVDCPYFAPNLNHNGVLHVLQMIDITLLSLNWRSFHACAPVESAPTQKKSK